MKNFLKYITKEFYHEEEKRQNTQSFRIAKKIESVGQEVLPEVSETASVVSDPSTTSTIYYGEEPTLPDFWYQQRVELIRKMYPDLPRHHKSKNKTWKQVYNEYINEMRKVPNLKADVIKEQKIERDALELAKRGLLEEEE
jgi:CTP:phosphocholine cytidylyltransferase-like protein